MGLLDRYSSRRKCLVTDHIPGLGGRGKHGTCDQGPIQSSDPRNVSPGEERVTSVYKGWSTEAPGGSIG